VLLTDVGALAPEVFAMFGATVEALERIGETAVVVVMFGDTLVTEVAAAAEVAAAVAVADGCALVGTVSHAKDNSGAQIRAAMTMSVFIVDSFFR
jgi:Ni,Fe-hydrogenase I small subunit